MILKLKDILRLIDTCENPIYIEYRTNSPRENEADMLFGSCKYINNELISMDGDDYSIEDEVYTYEWEDYNKLVVWIRSEWK